MLPEPTEATSEFGRLREQLVGHVPVGVPVPLELVRNAVIGSGLVLGAALGALLVIPDPDSIREGGFFLVAADEIGSWAAVLREVAGPLAILAVLCLAVDAYIWNERPAEDGWRYFCLAQPWTGLGTIGGCLAFVAVTAITLAIWAVIIGAIIAGALVLLAALADS